MISVDVKLAKSVVNLFHDTLNRGLENGDSPAISVQRAIRSLWRLAVQAGADEACREIGMRVAQLTDEDGKIRLTVTGAQLAEYLLVDPRFVPTEPAPAPAPPPSPTALGEAQHVKSVLESMGFAVDVVPPTRMRAYSAAKVPRPTKASPVPEDELPTAPQEVPKPSPSPLLDVLRNVFTNAPDLLEKAAEIEQTALRLAPMIEGLVGDTRVQRLAKTVLQHVQFPPPPPPADEETPPTTRN